MMTDTMVFSWGGELFGEDGKFVSCANDIDETVPAPFQYSPVNIAGPGLKLDPSEIVYSGCDCTAPSCDNDCPCIQRFGSNYTKDGKVILPQGIATEGDSRHRITKPIVECNTSCKCSSDCINRIVQNGLQFQLQVSKMDTKGWGLRTLEKIPQNSFVCEYAGEILTHIEAKQRTKALSSSDMNYILVVKESLSNGKVIRTHIDPTLIGNVGRFINHSCDPNLFQIVVRVDNEIPRVALFAVKDLEPLEELSYSYSGDDEGQSNDLTETRRADLQKPCHCRSEKCTGFLPLDGSLF